MAFQYDPFNGAQDTPPPYEVTKTQLTRAGLQAREAYLLDERQLRFQELYNRSAPAYHKELEKCIELMERSVRQRDAISQWVNRSTLFSEQLNGLIAEVKIQNQHPEARIMVFTDAEERQFAALSQEKQGLAVSMHETIKTCEDYVKSKQLPKKLDIPTVNSLLSSFSMSKEDLEDFLQIQQVSLGTIQTECQIMSQAVQAMDAPWKQITLGMTELRRLNAPGLVVRAGNLVKWGASSGLGAMNWALTKASSLVYREPVPLESTQGEWASVQPPVQLPAVAYVALAPSAPPAPLPSFSCDLPVEQLYPPLKPLEKAPMQVVLA